MQSRSVSQSSFVSLNHVSDEILWYIAAYLNLDSLLSFGLCSKRLLRVVNGVIGTRKNVRIIVPYIVGYCEAEQVAARFPKTKEIVFRLGPNIQRRNHNNVWLSFPTTRQLRTLSLAFKSCEKMHVNCYHVHTSRIAIRRVGDFLPWLSSLVIDGACVTDSELSCALKVMVQLKRITLKNSCELIGTWLSALPASIVKVKWISFDMENLVPSVDIPDDVAANIIKFSFTAPEANGSDHLIKLISRKFSQIKILTLRIRQVSVRRIQMLNLPTLQVLNLSVRHKLFLKKSAILHSKSFIDELSLKFEHQPDDSVYDPLFGNFSSVTKFMINCTEYVLSKKFCNAVERRLTKLTFFGFRDYFWTGNKYAITLENDTLPVNLYRKLSVKHFYFDVRFGAMNTDIYCDVIASLCNVAITRPTTCLYLCVLPLDYLPLTPPSNIFYLAPYK